jgi:hypothetical protein
MGCEVDKGGKAGVRKRWERQLSLLVVDPQLVGDRNYQKGNYSGQRDPDDPDVSVGIVGVTPKEF